MNDANEKLRWFTAATLVKGLAAGILAADPWYPGYAPPPAFADVLRDASAFFAKAGDENAMLQLGHDEVRRILRDFVHANETCIAWNHWGDPPDLVFTSRYSAQPKERQFIDLDAICQNAAYSISREYDD